MNSKSCLALAISLLALGADTALAHEGHDEHAAHFDAPQHGGVVLEFHDELHYEVVVAQGGQELQVWLGDAHRRPLAASEVTDLVAEIGHADKRVEPVDMHISKDGNYWTGTAHLKDPTDLVRIGFTYHLMTATSATPYDTFLHPPHAPHASHAGAHP
ncbi:MAG TPA: hypothetical protein VMF03_10080 [Steroidobacteraceae bacterium]|nr:hypothetical protein [Steroidobacteraceae bacterium]